MLIINMTELIISEVVARAKQIHIDLNIPSQEMDRFLNYLKQRATEKPKFVPCGGCLSNKVEMKPTFVRAFNTFNEKQKAEFYLKCVTIARDILENRGEIVPLVREEIKTITWNFFNESQKEWQTKMIDINYEKLTIKFRSTKEQIDLHQYILRTSKKKDKEKRILALQTTENVQDLQTIRLSNYKQPFEEFSKAMNNLIDCAIKQNFARMIDSQTISANKSQVTTSRRPMPQLHLLKANSEIAIKMPSEESFLASSRKQDLQSPRKLTKAIEKDEVKQGQLQKNMTFSFLSEHERTKARLIQSLESHGAMIYYHKNFLASEKQNRARKIFQIIQQDSSLPFQWFSDNMMVSSSFKRWKKSLKKSSMLSQSLDGTVRVFQEKHEFKDRTKGTYTYRRERIVRDQCMYFIDLPTGQKAEPQPYGQIEYAIWKFQKKGYLLTIISQAKLRNASQATSNSIIHILDEFLGSMDYICTNINLTLLHQTQLNVNSIMFDEEFISQIDRLDIADIDEFYSINDNQPEEPPQKDMKGRLNQHEISFTFTALNQSQYLSQINSGNLLKFKHPTKPFPKGKPLYRYPIKQGEHPYFQNEFAFSKEGEMISINKEKLKAQSSVLKDVLKSIGRNLFSGKSILNISLPVTVFSVQSNLSLICKSYAYAPALLEKAAKEPDPVMRMKFIASFAMTTTVAYLQMDKPFNPILGETFQTIIDGCLVYGEQVSHHPPISATFMKGRGYTLYGSFQAKVNMGLNSATGSNEGILHISFDQNNIKKQIVKVAFPPGEVTGLTYGVRKVAATKTGYVLDQENHLFLELNFNRHKGKTEYCKFYDGVQGRIVQLSQGSIPSHPSQVKKKSITREFGLISGRWTSQIYYEDELIFDSWKDKPFSCEKYPCPLQSDAYYRKDLIQRMANDYEAAQLAKQELQQIQRNDRKLRKTYTGKQH